MRLAILAPVHGDDASKVIRQTRNYIQMLRGSSLYFLFHISAQSSDRFRDQLTTFTNNTHSESCLFYIAEMSKMTSVRSVLNALVVLADLLNRLWLSPDYVIWHTDSDLIIRRGLSEVLPRFSFGVGRNTLDLESSRWVHIDKMKGDGRILRALRHYGIAESELYYGRTECSFYEFRIWTYISQFLMQFFDDSFFDDSANHWCAEEVILPTLSEHLRQQHDLLGRDQLGWTKKVEHGYATRDAINSFITTEDIGCIKTIGWYYSAKWFRA